MTQTSSPRLCSPRMAKLIQHKKKGGKSVRDFGDRFRGGGGAMTELQEFTDLPNAMSGNLGTPKSSILIGVSILNHPFWGTPIFGNTHISRIFLNPKCKRKESRSTLTSLIIYVYIILNPGKGIVS